MHEVLRDIVERAHARVSAARRQVPLEQLAAGAAAFDRRDFRRRITSAAAPAVIAEIKLASPTHPDLGSPDQAVERVVVYEAAGADAVSFITEPHYFKGDATYIARLKSAAGLPVLQKDFVVDEYQIYEAARAGADALLLIARLVDAAQLRRFVALALELKLEPVVEINDEADLEKAVAAGPNIIAVNARDLTTFAVDVAGACHLLERVPTRFVRLGFSGIESAREVQQYQAAGADGVLVGTALMQAPDAGAFIRGLRQ